MAELNRSCNTCKHNPVADVGQYPCNECRRDILPKYEAKVITRGNCMMCGKEFKPLTPSFENNSVWDLNNGVISFKSNNETLSKLSHYAGFWDARHKILIELYKLRDKGIQSVTISEMEKIIMDIPTEQISEEKTGHWIEMPIGFKCSKCNNLEDKTTKFCPDCGARMVEQEREDKEGENERMVES